MMKCRLPFLSTRNSILPPLISVTALATSAVTVPTFGFGIRPRGPSTRPSRPTLPIRSGVATTASKSRKPPWIRSMRSSEPTKSAPAAFASSARGPVANTRTRAVLPVPFGRLTVPRTIWSCLRGSTPSRRLTSTVGSNLVTWVALASSTASAGLYSCSWLIFSAAFWYALLRFMCVSLCWKSWSSGPSARVLPLTYGGFKGFLCRTYAAACRPSRSALDRDAHRAGGARDDLLGCLDRGRVQVGHLGLRDLAKLRRGERADLGRVRLTAALVHAGGLLDQLGRGRRLGDERERPVLVDGDLDRDDVASLGLGRSVVLPHEVHDVDAVRAQRGAHRRGRGGRARGQLHLHDGSELLPSWRHWYGVPLRSSRPGRTKARPASPGRRSTQAP